MILTDRPNLTIGLYIFSSSNIVMALVNFCIMLIYWSPFRHLVYFKFCNWDIGPLVLNLTRKLNRHHYRNMLPTVSRCSHQLIQHCSHLLLCRHFFLFVETILFSNNQRNLTKLHYCFHFVRFWVFSKMAANATQRPLASKRI